jgi:uncharacterized membrane protein (DUF106 family)
MPNNVYYFSVNREELVSTQEEMDKVKEEYVKMCEEKDKMRGDIHTEWQGKLESSLQQVKRATMYFK